MTAENGFAISARGIAAGYGKNLILKDVSLTVQKGGVTGISGPNGAGKSTFIKICLGIIRPQRGVITVMGGTPWGRGGLKLRMRMGYVPQNTAGGTLPLMVRDAVSMGLYGKTGLFRPIAAKDRARMDAVMEACGIRHLAAKTVQ